MLPSFIGDELWKREEPLIRKRFEFKHSKFNKDSRALVVSENISIVHLINNGIIDTFYVMVIDGEWYIENKTARRRVSETYCIDDLKAEYLIAYLIHFDFIKFTPADMPSFIWKPVLNKNRELTKTKEEKTVESIRSKFAKIMEFEEKEREKKERKKLPPSLYTDEMWEKEKKKCRYIPHDAKKTDRAKKHKYGYEFHVSCGNVSFIKAYVVDTEFSLSVRAFAFRYYSLKIFKYFEKYKKQIRGDPSRLPRYLRLDEI